MGRSKLTLFLYLIVFALIFTSTAHAGVTNPYANATTFLTDRCPENGNVFARIVVCMEDTVVRGTQYFIQEFYNDEIINAMVLVLLLAVILFGVKLAAGEHRRVANDTMVFLLKFGAVMYFIGNVDELYLQFVGMLTGVVNTVGNVGAYAAGLRCEPLPFDVGVPVGSYASTEPMWQRADCIFDMVIGLSSNAIQGGGSAQEGLQRGMMGFFFYNFYSGALGMLIGLAGLYICFNLVMALLRASYTYLLALLVLSLLFIIGALFMPLIMFANTSRYFETWVKMIIAMILQPLILFAYLNIMFVAFDLLLFSGSNSLMNTIAGDAANNPGFNIHTYAEANDLYDEGSKQFTHDLDQSELDTSALDPNGNEGSFGNIKFTDLKPDYENLSQLKIDLQYRTINYDNIPGGAGALAGATLLVGLCSYILVTFMSEIPKMARDLAGGIHKAPAVISAGSENALPLSGQISNMGSNMTKGVREGLSGLVGQR